MAKPSSYHQQSSQSGQKDDDDDVDDVYGINLIVEPGAVMMDREMRGLQSGCGRKLIFIH